MNNYANNSPKTADEIGEWGEQAFRDRCDAKKNIYIDVCKDDKFYEVDVDFLMVRDNQLTPIDVKTDTLMNSTGNIVFETSRATKTGWGIRSHAKYIYYVAYQLPSEAYWLNLERLREYVAKTFQGVAPRKFKTDIPNDPAWGYLIQLQTLIFLGIATKVSPVQVG